MSPRLCTLGEAMIRLSPPPGERISTARSFEATVGGTELNVAIAAAAMGIDSTWATSVPPGPLGERILRHAHAAGVTVANTPLDERVGLYFVEVGEEPRGTSVIYDRSSSAFSALENGVVDIAALTSSADAVFTTGITLALGFGPRQLAESFLQTAPASTLRAFEINYRSKLSSSAEAASAVKATLGTVDILFASDFDLSNLLDLGGNIESAAQRALLEWDLTMVVVPTRTGSVGGTGTNRVSVFTRGDVLSVEQIGRILDPVGAGDAGTGAFLAEYLTSGDLLSASKACVQASAFKQTLSGDGSTFTRSEIMNPSTQRISR